ncbi:MAG: hypothetical protein ACOYJ2_08855 [Rickettsiales bacterium]
MKPLHDALKVYLESKGLPYEASAFGFLRANNSDLQGPKVLITMKAPERPLIENAIQQIQDMGRQGQIEKG